jgi:hypothetical protein
VPVKANVRSARVKAVPAVVVKVQVLAVRKAGLVASLSVTAPYKISGFLRWSKERPSTSN